MKRDSSMDSAIGILIILFCPILLLLSLIGIVWALALRPVVEGRPESGEGKGGASARTAEGAEETAASSRRRGQATGSTKDTKKVQVDERRDRGCRVKGQTDGVR